jgi:uncharacterized RDD family membrane protein YckC
VRVSGLAHASSTPAGAPNGHSTPVAGPVLDNRRVAAALVDLVVVGALVGLLSQLAGGLTAGVAAVGVGWALFYYFALESGGGQTLGKRLLRLRVTGEDGDEPGIERIAVRTLLRLLDGLGLYLVGLVVMLVTGQRRQRLGDVVAHTVVTSAEAETATSEDSAGEPDELEDAPSESEEAPSEPAPDVPAEPAPVDLPVEPAGEDESVPDESVPDEADREEDPFPADAPAEDRPAAPVPLARPPAEDPPLDPAAAAPAEPAEPDRADDSAEAEGVEEAMPVKRVEIVSPIELIMAEADAPADSTDDRDGRPDGEQPAV